MYAKPFLFHIETVLGSSKCKLLFTDKSENEDYILKHKTI